MSLREVPPFDVLSGGNHPYEGFGTILREHQWASPLREVAANAQRRVHDVFERETALGRSGVAVLDSLIREMWASAWSPERGSVNLFAMDFGCIFMLAIHRECGGECLSRSSTDLSHASVWWPASGVEAFPFHRVLRALQHDDGESLVFFFDRLKHTITPT